MLSTISKYLLSNDCSALDFVVEFSYLTLLLLRDDSVDVRNGCSQMIVNLCLSFEKNGGNSNVIASYAQEKYLRFLTNLMQKKGFTTVQMISVQLIVIGLLENSEHGDDSEVSK
jgi:tryptophan 2,3-dioxygenase